MSSTCATGMGSCLNAVYWQEGSGPILTTVCHSVEGVHPKASSDLNKFVPRSSRMSPLSFS